MGRWRPTACGDGPTLALPPPPDRREPDSAWRGPGCHSDAPSPLESGSAHGHPSSWTGTEISSIRLWQCGRALPRGDPGLLHSRGCEAAQVWGWMGVETPRQNLPSGDCPSSALLRSKGSAGLGRGCLPHTVLGAAEGGAAAGVQDRQTPPGRPGRAATPLGPDEGANADNRKSWTGGGGADGAAPLPGDPLREDWASGGPLPRHEAEEEAATLQVLHTSHGPSSEGAKGRGERGFPPHEDEIVCGQWAVPTPSPLPCARDKSRQPNLGLAH